MPRTMEEFQASLRDQLSFIDASAHAYDMGPYAESLRLATTIRVLVHDTPSSRSLLAHLGVKDSIQFVTGDQPDSAPPPNSDLARYLESWGLEQRQCRTPAMPSSPSCQTVRTNGAPRTTPPDSLETGWYLSTSGGKHRK
ncbi:hypothetical protein HII28_13525 [Planctomonas sp. JC2975]|uniref:hypothetical protein n=1 Tax=Planctomonas sp. JC2975 TaxID=2729626 RepID=UPI001473DCE3|nr:hypothetical protein [Planctomonas sp. JC2975]NNC12892.1 hypothetical protein [Planctomonas sp. JC2975]